MCTITHWLRDIHNCTHTERGHKSNLCKPNGTQRSNSGWGSKAVQEGGEETKVIKVLYIMCTITHWLRDIHNCTHAERGHKSNLCKPNGTQRNNSGWGSKAVQRGRAKSNVSKGFQSIFDSLELLPPWPIELSNTHVAILPPATLYIFQVHTLKSPLVGWPGFSF